MSENYTNDEISGQYNYYEELDTIICKTTIPRKLSATFSNSQYMDLVVIVPTEALALYQATDVWKDFWCLQGGAENYISTDINSITIGNNNSSMSNTIYDLQGHMLKSPQKGINIINGKKVLIK